jgi:hypothetical protein
MKTRKKAEQPTDLQLNHDVAPSTDDDTPSTRRRRRNPEPLDSKVVTGAILAYLKEHGPTGKTRLGEVLGLGATVRDALLDALLSDGRLEKYKTRSARNRVDEFLCLPGGRPVAKGLGNYRGAETLAAFQSIASSRLGYAPLATTRG